MGPAGRCPRGRSLDKVLSFMRFQLSIAEGKEAGRAFEFDQTHITIGRSTDCDVVLYEAGVSRRHARIFAEGGGYAVEDQASANGTHLNGQKVRKQRLQEGDLISLGPVVFRFNLLEDEPHTDEVPVVDQSTRIVDLDQVKRAPAGPAARSALVPSGANAEQLRQMSGRATRAIPAVRRPEPSPVHPARGTAERPRPSPAGPGQPDAPVLSAAERARLRRQGGAAPLKIWWLQASRQTRTLVHGGAAGVLLGAIGLAYVLVLGRPQQLPDLAPEPSVLSRAPIEESFGLGPEVTYRRPDMKVFTFDFISPVRALVILHFQAADISAGEVTVSANGVEVATVPPDTLNAADRVIEVVIPATVLKRGEPNQIIFDNIRNPPGADPWRIWNLSITPEALPELPLEQLQVEAKEAFDRAVRYFDRRDIGAENRYQAWKDFRKAWLLLEGHPEPRPAMYRMALARMREAQQELDATCARLMLDVQTKLRRRDRFEARNSLDTVALFFPNEGDQLCARKATVMRLDYQL
jgi:pSer/pThr/pTyr-binding forkhead associated (FHA) protein